MAGITTFKRGCVWQAGDRQKINIWSDSWIPTSPNMRIISPMNGDVYTKVSDLIDPTTSRWDEDMLNTLFCTVDVGHILQILQNDQGFEDFLAWGFTKHGRDKVCSRYYLQWKH
jgi:hypothetical protein